MGPIPESTKTMKLLILGATGPTGHHILEEAPQAGDSCTAFVRNPAALGNLAGQVTVVTGDATSQRDVAAAMPGHDAVICALGRGRSLTADKLFSRAATAVIEAAKQSGVSRLVWLSSFGVGDTLRSASAAQRLRTARCCDGCTPTRQSRTNRSEPAG